MKRVNPCKRKNAIVISPARQISFELLNTIDSGRVFSDDALHSGAMHGLEARDRHLVTEIVYGTLRRQLLLDHVLAGASSRKWRDVDSGAKTLLRMSLYQLWFMDRIPDHALVNDAVELAKKNMPGNTFRYLNGILRHLARNRPWEESSFGVATPKWVQVSLPEWLWRRWRQRFGEEIAAEYSESLNAAPDNTFRLGKDPDLNAISFEVKPSDLVPGAYIRDRSTDEGSRDSDSDPPAQDEASQLVPHLLGDVSGAFIWDACAAPGGKASVLCAKTGLSGRVVASDISRKRVFRLRQVLHRSGFNPEIVVADAGAPSPFGDRFDAVVADVPCSGLGTLRRNPEIKWRFRPSDLDRLRGVQLSIIGSLSESVRKGGRLLYSTCSTEPEENESVIGAFLESHPGFSVDRPSGPEGIDAWVTEDGYVRTFPSTRLWDGLFAAVLRRHR